MKLENTLTLADDGNITNIKVMGNSSFTRLTALQLIN